MYEERDKDGNVIGWRITRRVKNEIGSYDCIIARPKISEEDCKQQLNKKLVEYAKESNVRKKERIISKDKMKDFADSWYKLNIEHADLSKSSKNHYRSMVYNSIIPFFGDMLVCQITESDCQRFLNQYEGMSKAHASKARMTLNRLFKKAIRQRIASINPCEDLQLPKCYTNQRRPLSDEERELLYLAAQTHFAGPMFVLMLHTGMRPIEIRNLKWKDIDFEKNVLVVTKSKTEAGTGRLLPIDEYVKEMLINHKKGKYAVTPKEKEKYKNRNKEFVFYKRDNSHLPLDTSAFAEQWKSFKRKMDEINGARFYRNRLVETTLADDLAPYLLRHTFCTDCQTAGIPINVAKELMGHSDISVTAKIYTHMVDEVFTENAQRLEEYHENKSRIA